MYGGPNRWRLDGSHPCVTSGPVPASDVDALVRRGPGTTVAVARRLGRVGIGLDLRMNQCELARRRLAEPVRVVKGVRPPRATPSDYPGLFPLASEVA